MDVIQKTIQSIFYIVATILAVLTYTAARRGLLNTVNTEYHKKVIERLFAVSLELYEEFDQESPWYWPKMTFEGELVSRLNEDLKDFKHEFLTQDGWVFGTPTTKLEIRLRDQHNRFRSDPFLPRNIREVIVSYLDARSEAVRLANQSAKDQYLEYMKKNNDAWKKMDDHKNWVHNVINERLYAQGYGISQVEAKVHSIREDMQSYFESFNPLSSNSILFSAVLARSKRSTTPTR